MIFLLGLIAPLIFMHYHGGVIFCSEFNKQSDWGLDKAKMFVERFPPIRSLEFISGVALCVGFQKLLPLKKNLALLTLAGGILWVLLCIHFPFILLMGTLTMPGFALIILGAASLPFPSVGSSPAWIIQLGKFAILLGNASYAVYLFHQSIIYYLLKINKYAFHFLPTSPWAFFGILAFSVTIITTILSIAVFLFYEEPARIFVKDILSQK